MNSANTSKPIVEINRESAFPWASAYAISTAVIISIAILAIVGFSSPDVIHNAAHDLRHSMIFPCH